MNDGILEHIGLLVDKAENHMAVGAFPDSIALSALKHGMADIRDHLRGLYEKCGGNCDETWPLGPYTGAE